MPQLHTLFERLRATLREQAIRHDLMERRAAIQVRPIAQEPAIGNPDDADYSLIKARKGIGWCDLILATGSSIANGTLADFLDTGKRAIFYGATIAAAAEILGLERCTASAGIDGEARDPDRLRSRRHSR